MRLIEFEVIDNQTGESPDCEKIALTEEWAKRLIYCDIDCFAITEDGSLILIDDCNNIAYPPSDRFTVTYDPDTLRPKGRWEKTEDDYCGLNLWQCSLCNEEWCFEIDDDVKDLNYNYCPNCGADMREY